MNIQLDETDIKILNYLQQNARMNHKELGDQLHKAPTTIYTRITKLEKAGLIKGYAAILDPELVSRGQTVFTHVQLDSHTEKSLRQFEEAIARMPEVMECYHVTGDYDFMLRIVTKDIKSYHEFLMSSLFKIETIAKTDTTVIMREAKKATAYELQLADIKA